jgi:23S rRNA (uracil1939-C5)-methyltransferase
MGGSDAKPTPPEEVELTIESLAAGGRGVARHEGRVWFVRGGLPEDRLVARVEREKERFVEAHSVRLVSPSPQRRESPCAVSENCGGCPWISLPESIQGEWKWKLVRDALQRIGGFEGLEPEPLQQPVVPLGYRDRVEFSLRHDPGGEGSRLGLWGHDSSGSRELVPTPRCEIQSEGANAILKSLRERCGVATDADRILVRRASNDRYTIGIWQIGPKRGSKETMLTLAKELMERHPEIAGVVKLRSRPGKRAGIHSESILGSGVIQEQIAGEAFALYPTTFTQVSRSGGDALVELVGTLAGDLQGKTAWDLYGGVGAYGVRLARLGAEKVFVCEADAGAIAAGKRTADEAKITALRYVRGDVGRFLRERRDAEVDLIVANPPRGGFAPGVARALVERKAARLILVSCDPATLARDLKRLVRSGYQIEKIVPVDLFPQTAHVETVTSLRLTEAEPPKG